MNDKLYKPKYKFIDNMRWIFGEMKKSGGFGAVISSVIPGLLMSLTNIVLMKMVVDCITEGAEISFMVTAVAIYTVITSICLVWQQTVNQKIFFKYLNSLRYNILRLLLHKSMVTDYANIESLNGRNMAQNSIQAIGNMAIGICQSYSYLQSALTNVFGITCIGVLLGFADPYVIIVCILAVAVTTILAVTDSKISAKVRVDSLTLWSKMAYYSTQVPSEISYAKDIRLYGMADWFRETVNIFFGDYKKLFKNYRKQKLVVYTVTAVTMLLRDGAVFYLLIRLCNKGIFTAGDFAFYFSAIRVFVSWLSQLENDFFNFNILNNQVDQVRDFLLMPDKEYEKPAANLCDGVIEFNNVRFSYDGEKDVLNGVSFKVKKGEKIAIVGANGAGKTTCVKLLCGLYKPTSGEIKINGENICNTSIKDTSHLFSAVFQDAFILPSTVERNVSLSHPERTDRERVLRCLEQAQLKEKIDNLPHGVETLLNKDLFEEAVEFSGGETQRLFLARALYKDAPIIILDEPTAALDPIAENNMYLKYNEMTKGKTSFYISHRLASTGFCDRIFFFKDGKISESGTHEELMRQNGGYAEMYKVQSKYYKEGEKL